MITLDLFESKPNKKLNENVQLGNAIKALYRKIHAQGDDAVEFMYYDSPIFAQYWDEYEGDLDSIIAEVDPRELQVILDELQSAAEDQGVAEAVGLDRSKVPNYPHDPATVKHRIDTAKAILSNPKSDPDSRQAAAAILAKHKGVAENKLHVKKIASEQELIEHAKIFAKNLSLEGVPLSSMNHFSVICSTLFAHNRNSLNESAHITNGKQFVQVLKGLDQFSQLPIKVGSSVAIINSQLQGDSVELWGFTTPKKISKIYRDPSDNSIKQFEFNNDPADRWPRTENAEYNGQFLMYSAFFGDKKSADHALTMLMLKGSDGLNIRNHITEQGVAEGWTKLPSGDYQNSHTGVRTSKPPVKKKRGEKTGAEWDAINAKKQQGVAEASPETTLNLLKGLKSWQVVIRNNYYRGKYADYSGRYYYVLATSPEQARRVVLDNADAILQELLAMKSVNGRKILPRSSAVPITADRIGEIKDGTEAGRMTTAGYKRMFGPQGPMMVKLDGGAIADVKGQEPVNEISPHDYDSDEDYYAAMKRTPRVPRGRSADDYDDYIDEPQDSGDDESYYEKYVRTKGLEERQAAGKKKDSEPEVTDVGLQRAISKSKAAFPTAQSGVQALMKDFMQGQEKDQQEFAKVRRADRRQDQLLAQISQLDKEQEKELQDLDKENNSLAQRLQQLQSVNDKLQQTLATMSGRKEKPKAEKPADTKPVDKPSINIATPASQPVSAQPKKEKTPSSMAATAKQLSAPKKADPMAAMAQRIQQGDQSITDKITGQKSLAFEPTDNVIVPRLQKKKYEPATDITDVEPKYYADLTSKIAQQAITDPERAAHTYSVHENDEKEADYGDEYQDMVARVAQKAREQEKKKPVDIKDLARRLAAVKLKDEK